MQRNPVRLGDVWRSERRGDAGEGVLLHPFTREPAYVALFKFVVDNRLKMTAVQMGRHASLIGERCRSLGLPIGRVTHSTLGTVCAYPVAVLEAWRAENTKGRRVRFIGGRKPAPKVIASANLCRCDAETTPEPDPAVIAKAAPKPAGTTTAKMPKIVAEPTPVVVAGGPLRRAMKRGAKP